MKAIIPETVSKSISSIETLPFTYENRSMVETEMKQYPKVQKHTGRYEDKYICTCPDNNLKKLIVTFAFMDNVISLTRFR